MKNQNRQNPKTYKNQDRDQLIQRLLYLEQFEEKYENIKIEVEVLKEKYREKMNMIHAVEEDYIWNFIAKYRRTISAHMPPESFSRKLFELLKRKTISRIKRKHLSKKTMAFIESLKKYQNIDILFINHEETLTGAPKILLDIACHLKHRKNVAIVSLQKGSMHNVFQNRFASIIYPGDAGLLDKFELARIVILGILPKVVFVNSICSYEYAFEAKKNRIPVIFHVHELKGGFDCVLTLKEQKKISGSADLFIAVSKKVENLLIHDLGCNPDSVRLVHEFISRDMVRKQSLQIPPDAIRKELNIKPDDFIVMGIGTFNHRKGADLFIKCFKLLENTYPGKIKFVWVGNLNLVNDFLKRSNMHPNLLFLGEKPNPFPYLNIADVFLLPSREDPFPLVVLEAMALGKPVVAFNNSGGAPEAIKNCGLLTQKMDYQSLSCDIEKLYQNKELLTQLSQSAEVEVEKYDTTTALPKIERIIDTVLHRQPPQFNPKVSVVLLNSDNNIQALKNSILSFVPQRYKNIEILILNYRNIDVSKVLEEFSSQISLDIQIVDKAAEVFELADFFKSGLVRSSGGLVCFAKSGDVYSEEYLELHVNLYKQFPGLIVTYEKGKYRSKYKSGAPHFISSSKDPALPIFKMMLKKNCIPEEELLHIENSHISEWINTKLILKGTAVAVDL